MKRYLVIAAVLSVSAYFLCGALLAQEEEETEFSLGKVNSVSADQIIIAEYDYGSEQQVEVAYTIAPDVKLSNVNSLKDIMVGSDVWIDYVTREGKKVAVSIEVREPTAQEETTPQQTVEEEPESSLEEPAETQAPINEEEELE